MGGVGREGVKRNGAVEWPNHGWKGARGWMMGWKEGDICRMGDRAKVGQGGQRGTGGGRGSLGSLVRRRPKITNQKRTARTFFGR